MTSSRSTTRLGNVFDVGGVPIDDVTFAETVNLIIAWAADSSGGYVCTPNVDHVVRAQHDGQFRQAVLGARLRVPDGMWIVRAARFARLPIRETVTGRLLVASVVERSGSMPIALFGSSQRVVDDASAHLKVRFPEANIVAAIAPPNPLIIGSDRDAAAIRPLLSHEPRVIFVALGAPKQELWMHRHESDFPRSVMVGVGQALDVLAGRVQEAPMWATRLGVEWAFRLVQEPRRLARRYLIDDPWIFLWAVRERLRRPRRRD